MQAKIMQAKIKQLQRLDLNDSDASEDKAPVGGMHSTSRGTHNLAMSGNMAIAHPDTRSLLAYLNMALDGNDEEAARRARSLAAHTGHGSSDTYRSCKGITAACLCIIPSCDLRGTALRRTPPKHAGAAQETATSGCEFCATASATRLLRSTPWSSCS